MMSSTRIKRGVALTAISLSLATTIPRGVLAQPDSTVKYAFFCGSSFADIQTDTCAQRQWCPSSSDDECLIPGHTCFANTPCDARTIPDIAVPTYSLSFYPEYRSAEDKMFCGSDYPNAVGTCEKGDEEAIAMHCPDGVCPAGKTCFIEMPCSYFVMTNPLANPLSNPGEVTVDEKELPDPDSFEAHYYCGATFVQAESDCSSKTWCRTGTDQECPNGESCFAYIESCEINAIVKKEMMEAGLTDNVNDTSGAVPVEAKPTTKPTFSPLTSTDPLNRSFCGFSFNDASSNCHLERACPSNSDDDCPDGMTCWEYTSCNAHELTGNPTTSPTPLPSSSPTNAPIRTSPTNIPTTSKPSRDPTPPPSGLPTIKPTNAPSKKPTHSPLPADDFRRLFWCGLDWFDAESKCSLKCPSGGDDECPGDLKCISGVASCKFELGLEVYDEDVLVELGLEEFIVDEVEATATTTTEATKAAAADGDDSSNLVANEEATTEATTEATKGVAATKPAATTQAATKPAATTQAAATQAATTTTATTVIATSTPTIPLQGPFHEDLVRIILYGLDTLDNAALSRWTILTASYFQEFFNDYHESSNNGAADFENVDAVRASAYDVTVEIDEVVQEIPPEHDFNPLIAGEVAVKSGGGRDNGGARHHRVLSLADSTSSKTMMMDTTIPIGDTFDIRQLQNNNDATTTDTTNSTMIMITFQQTTTYRTSLEIINENDSRYITRRPLETPKYRAEYVSYLRAQDYATFGNLEFASHVLFTEFPTAAPTETPTTASPVEAGQPTLKPNTPSPTTLAPVSEPPTMFPTTNLVCNLCLPGQYGVNANIIWNDEVSTCVEIYNWFLTNHKEGSGECRRGVEELSSVCCRDSLDGPLPPPSPTPPTNEPPVSRPVVETDLVCNLCEPKQYGVNADITWNGEASTCTEIYNYFLTNHKEGSFECNRGEDELSSICCRDSLESGEEDQTTTAEIKPVPSTKPTTVLEIPVDENGLPDAASLAETYYCGVNWDSVSANCDSATACPSGDSGDCPSGEQCIAFTNCGGKFSFVSDPNNEGGGPDVESVKSTFYCGSSMQFLEMKCDGATPCPNGPDDCNLGGGIDEGCFAFTGCNASVDPGSFVGFLALPSDGGEDSKLPTETYKSFYCGATWADLDGKCVDGVPEGAIPCPSGDVIECPEGNGCFAFACNNGLPPKPSSNAAPAPSPNAPPIGDYSVEDLDLLKSTFFCGSSVAEIDADCESAIPCPSGDECPDGFGCFAFSQCGGVDISKLTDSFGRTDMPTRAPTVPIEQVCDQERKMSVNVGYWQSWSIYRNEDCQRMETTSFDASPYTHVVYSFASIDKNFRLEAWNSTYNNEVPLYKDFNTVKQRHPGVRTMIAVGGWTHNDPGPMQTRFSEMASSKTTRQIFAQSVVQFLRTYGFDGLDLDWEYPGLKERGGKRDDYDNYVLLTKEIRNAFNSAPEAYELTVAVTGNVTKLEMGFDLEGLAENVDWFNIMAYDLWGSWDPKQIAYSHTDIRMIDEAVEYMSHFIQKSKLVLGLGSYARTYTLEDDDCLDLGCPFKGPGKSGCEGTDGFLPYFEIADMVTQRKYDSIRFDDETESMVMITDGNRLISYDNTVSFNKKSEYANDQCFMGTMLWAIDMLKDGANPLSSNNGNSALTGDPSDQSFCGKDYQDVINGCKQPCPSGDSSQCPAGEFCFANTGCSIDNIGAPPPTKCRLCPDPSTQGMKGWLEVDYNGETMTCADADMTAISEFAKGSDECDAAKSSLGSQCCFNYPEDPCMMCRSETQFMDLRALAEIEFEGETMTCGDLSKRLGPEERDSQMCMAAQSDLWDSCCYNQCTLCEGKGVKWWTEIEFEEEPLNCGELDSVLYSNSTEEDDEMCADVLSNFGDECCYEYPNNPCDLCTKGDKKFTLMPGEEVDFDGSTFTCAEVNNFLSPFESNSKQCSEARDSGFESCCFDRCSLCGNGARLDAEILIDIDGETGTCADIEAGLFQEKVETGAENCTLARTLHYDACCFEIPAAPCQLCAQDQYMHFSTEVEFNDDTVTCRSVNNFLMERADTSSNECYDARATLGETCCYSTCNICGDFDLDWDVFINYEGQDMSCGDFNEIFREEQIVDGSEQCEAVKSEYYNTCCYSSPTTSCQLCKHDGTFYDLNEKVEVDFNGPTTCYEVANFLSRRVEENEQICSVMQTSLYDECCYEKCSLSHAEGTYPDWTAEVELDGEKATCFDLDTAIKDAAIAKETDECNSLQEAFSPTCSFSIPSNPCDMCAGRDVSFTASAEYLGKEMKCSDIASRLSTREEADGDACLAAQESLTDCCFDQCHLCDAEEETDAELTVYDNGKTTKCTDVDVSFNEKMIFASSEECSTSRDKHRETCCFSAPKTPCNMCKRGADYFDLMGTNQVTFMDKTQTCAGVSDMMFRREEESSETCSMAKENFFETCCNTKCSLCGGKGLEAGVKVNYEGRSMTCLEIDLGLAIEAGSDQCNAISSQFANQCCFDPPENPCRMCPGDSVGVNTAAVVTYLGTNTTCDSLSNYLGSREEQNGATCTAASAEHNDDCCYERCSLCDNGKADWETFVQYEGRSIACGDFEWILRGKNVAADSDTCSAVKDEYYDKCCYTAPATSCNLCYVDGEYLDVSSDATVNYQGSSTKCANLYNSLFMREAADSDQCEATKVEHADTCCFEKCKLCQGGFMDTTAKVNVNGQDISCSALDMSFSIDVIAAGSDECDALRQDYADSCCYTLPDAPCRLCSAGSEVAADKSIDFEGETKSCSDVANKLAMSEEAGSDTCSTTQTGYSTSCCFETCPICPEGFNLRWEVDVEYNRATVSCGEFDGIIKGNGIMKNSKDCTDLQSTYSSACCYNYATSSYAPSNYYNPGSIGGGSSGSGPMGGGSPGSTGGGSTGGGNYDGTYASFSNGSSGNPSGPGGGTSGGADGSGVGGDGTGPNSTGGGTSGTAVGSSGVNAGPSGAGPCNLCKAGEISINAEILFNGVETSCSDVNNFLAIQTQEGSETCTMGKNALHDACCLEKCDLCSGGGIPDWYAMVNVNGNSMTCLELDSIITDSQIQSGSTQCSEVLAVAAPACCYVPPEEPCNICKNGSEVNDVMSSVEVSYGGTSSTCGAIFNALFSREEEASETCSLVTKDLRDQCCYSKCSLCGNLQNNAATTVEHDGSKLGCSEFDSYIFASNFIVEGANECKAFQADYKEACCYDVSCNLCSKGDTLYTPKDSAMVNYGGNNVTCGEVSTFLSKEMSQSNVCLAAQENIFEDCCFEQCELCDVGQSINWASSTSFNGMTQSCTDIYWMLITESVEANDQVCSSVRQVASDCCFKMPKQQCTLCRDDNGVTYNTRWNTDVTVNGLTRTCGDFNTLLSTQESGSETCSAAKDQIFNECCFAGSESLVAKSTQVSTETDADAESATTEKTCNLCKPGQVGINADITFNDNPTKCVEVYNFLVKEVPKGSTICASAMEDLASICCKEPEELTPEESEAFGTFETVSDGEATPEANAPKITPPVDFDGWGTVRSGGSTNARLTGICAWAVRITSMGLFLLSLM